MRFYVKKKREHKNEQNIYIMVIFTYFYGDTHMKSKEVEIIKFLLENKDENLTINQIATILKKDYKNVHTIIKRLEAASFITLESFGNSYKVTLNTIMHPLLFEAEYGRRGELLKNKDISIMFDYFKKLKTKFYVLLVFGSYAKKRNNKSSDIDLMFIIPNSSESILEKEIYGIGRTIPLLLHITIFTETDFKAMIQSKAVTVGQEAMKHNVILYGIEAFYEMRL